MATALVVLAAGQGTRMNSDLPKVLHLLGGVPLFVHALAAGRRAGAGAGGAGDGPRAPRRSKPRRWTTIPRWTISRQTEQLGTAHAVLQARRALQGFCRRRCGAVRRHPVRDGLRRWTGWQAARASADVVVLGFRRRGSGPLRPAGDGRRPVAADRRVEGCDGRGPAASPCATRASFLSPAGARCSTCWTGSATTMWRANTTSPTSSQLANAEGLACTAVDCPEAETLGVNTRAELAAAEALPSRPAPAPR